VFVRAFNDFLWISSGFPAAGFPVGFPAFPTGEIKQRQLVNEWQSQLIGILLLQVLSEESTMWIHSNYYVRLESGQLIIGRNNVPIDLGVC